MPCTPRPSLTPGVLTGRVLALVASFSALGGTGVQVRAELPPWVYGERQRQAPLVVRLQVLEAVREGSEARVRGRLLRVWRQPAASKLTAGQTIGIRYSLAPERAPGWAGPSSLPLPERGEERTAWLQPISGAEPAVFAPAAGGFSFGPSLERVQAP